MKRYRNLFFLFLMISLTMACVIPGSKPAPTATLIPTTAAPPTKAPVMPTLPPVPTQPPAPTAVPTKAPVQASPTALVKPTLPPQPTATQALGVGSKKTVKPDNMEMVFVPAGRFTMGGVDSATSPDEVPTHVVSVSAFWIDKTEVTVAMYTLCVKAGVCKEPVSTNAADYKDYFYDQTYANFPVVNVRWDDAQSYCQWAGRRLPTEAEWEKAARGEDRRVYPWGTKEPDQNLANFNWIRRNPAQVGSYPQGASPYGALDMAGNVGEWIFDFYKDDFYKESPDTDPKGPATTFRGQARVQRGGNYQSSAAQIRVSKRGFGMALDPKNPQNYEPTYSSTIGFRCAISEGK
jgi:formylglycine-generating enzyme required for sulfatase activity